MVQTFRMAMFGFSWLCYVRHCQSSSRRWVAKQESENLADTMSVKQQIFAVIGFFNPVFSALALLSTDLMHK